MEKTLSPAFIELSLEADTKKQALSLLVEKMYNKGVFTEQELFLEAVLEREKLFSTYCGFHIAIPHAVSKTVKSAAFGFCRTNALEWDENDEPVHYILLLAIPESKDTQNSQHIDMMSQIASLALEEEVRLIWEKAKTKDEILKTFTNF